jgi:hypothetical protein
VKLRGRTRRQAALGSNETHRAVPKRPGWRRGRTIFLSARGAKPHAHHGPLERLLDGMEFSTHLRQILRDRIHSQGTQLLRGPLLQPVDLNQGGGAVVSMEVVCLRCEERKKQGIRF